VSDRQSLAKSSQKQYGKFDKKSVGASPLKRDDDIVASWGDRAGTLHQCRIDGAGDAAHIGSPDIRASVAASAPVSFSPPKAPHIDVDNPAIRFRIDGKCWTSRISLEKIDEARPAMTRTKFHGVQVG
jgi:hypothetical protein